MLNDSILIVDDTPVNLRLVHLLLSRQGFDVRTANSAEEALKSVRKSRPRLVLADIELPGMNGLELTKRLKSNPRTRGIVVLALTAFAMEGGEQRALEAGCDGFITKPIDTRTFPALIRHYLGEGPDPATTARQAPSPAPSMQAPDDEASLPEIQRTFLAEGMQQSGQLIGTLGAGFDHAAALVTAHRWAGAAGSVGYMDITQHARALEAELQQNGSGSIVRTRELLVKLARLFATAMENELPKLELDDAPPDPQATPQDVAPPELRSTLAGKRFGLAGFDQEESARVAQVLDEYEAFSRDLGPEVLPDSETVRPFDVIIVNVTAGLKAIPEWNKPVLAIGPRNLLLRLQLSRNGTQDFVFSPWTAEDLILRSYFAISRGGRGDQSQPARVENLKPRVLVADDDSTIRALVEATLQNSGFECRVAADGGEAAEIIQRWRPDLAVLDVNMPNRSGFEVLSSLRNDPLTRDIRVILLTARQQETDVIKAFGLGADDYVIKPFSPMELTARLKRLLGKHV